ncbi:MAG: XRE family transcriptional regulator [Lentisphaeria bacterium]|jgi:transcriptional regulator with XRE-family HTH domain|nr:XRE family transcriptional regulator [Lentisphaeria bacterium]
MHNGIKEIALRVKELRELSDISAEEMAAAIDVSAAFYLAFEAGQEDISASSLYELAQKLGVDLALLLTGDMPRMNSFSVTRKGKGVAVERRKQYQYQALAANFANKKAEPFVVTVQPKPEGTQASLNQHPGQEMNYVLEGRMKIFICGNELVLEAGDSIFFDASNPHGMLALDSKPARFIAFIM